MHATVVLALACLVACAASSDAPAAPPPHDPPVPAAQTAAPASAGSPLVALEASDAAPWRGVVVERLEAGSYTYLRVDADARSRWVAVMGPGRGLGDRIDVESFGVQRDFHSRRLGRDFDELHFATVRDATP